MLFNLLEAKPQTGSQTDLEREINLLQNGEDIGHIFLDITNFL